MAGIICAGFGGQGVLTAGLILAKTAMDYDKNVSWIPSYGSEMRGGTANCNVIIVDGRVASPFVKKPDIVIAMNQPSVDKFAPMLNSGGTLIVNSSIVSNTDIRDDINVYAVAATDIATKEGNPRGANIAMIGALAATDLLLDAEKLCAGMEKFFDEKGKSNPKNAVCFKKGKDETKQIK